jgi:hypothetical protein
MSLKKIIIGLIILASLVFVIVFSVRRVLAAELKNERYYQTKWCNANSGRMEVPLSDGTRADCVTEKYAVEVDFAPKWAEGHGQALRYARLTGKRGVVVLIWKNRRDRLKAMNLVRDVRYYKLPVDVFLMEAE